MRTTVNSRSRGGRVTSQLQDDGSLPFGTSSFANFTLALAQPRVPYRIRCKRSDLRFCHPSSHTAHFSGGFLSCFTFHPSGEIVLTVSASGVLRSTAIMPKANANPPRKSYDPYFRPAPIPSYVDLTTATEPRPHDNPPAMSYQRPLAMRIDGTGKQNAIQQQHAHPVWKNHSQADFARSSSQQVPTVPRALDSSAHRTVTARSPDQHRPTAMHLKYFRPAPLPIAEPAAAHNGGHQHIAQQHSPPTPRPSVDYKHDLPTATVTAPHPSQHQAPPPPQQSLTSTTFPPVTSTVTKLKEPPASPPPSPRSRTVPKHVRDGCIGRTLGDFIKPGPVWAYLEKEKGELEHWGGVTKEWYCDESEAEEDEGGEE